MTAKELAEMLSGREYGKELTLGEAKEAKNAGLVVVYGRSDDGVEFQGAIIDEAEAYGGATIHITSEGLLDEPACGIAENIECPYFAAAKSAAKIVKAVWHDEGSPCWTFETDIPHETFTIVEDGEPWCIGIVFSMEHLREGKNENLERFADPAPDSDGDWADNPSTRKPTFEEAPSLAQEGA